MRIAKTRKKWVLGGVMAFLAAGCGGDEAPPPKAAPKQVKRAATKTKSSPTKKEQAAQKWSALSKDLDRLPPDKALDAYWLKDQMQEILKLDSHHSGARFNLGALTEKGFTKKKGPPPSKNAGATGKKGKKKRGRTSGATAMPPPPKAGAKARASSKEPQLSETERQKRARQVYEEIVDEDPDFVPARENLAAFVAEEGDQAWATATYKAIIGKDPMIVTSRLGLARILLTQGKYKEAIALCRKALQRKADAIEAFRVLAQAYHRTGNTPMAELIIGRGLKVSQKDIELHYLMAEIILAKGQRAAGIDKLKEVIRMKPDWLKVRAQLAAIAMEFRDFGGASQQYEKILEIAKDDRPAKVGLAVSYKGLGRYEQAEKIYKDLLKTNSKDPDVLWNIATLYHRHLRKWDDAIASYKVYAEVVPEADKKRGAVAKHIKWIKKTKSDLAAEQARQKRERKRQEAIQASCAAVEAGRPVEPQAAKIGNEQERIEVGWQLMVQAQEAVQAGDIAGVASASCAFAVVPNTPSGKTGACAPMHVMWTQVMYQLGEIERAEKSIDAALVCDPNNPDAQLIKQQLVEIKAQLAAEQKAMEEAAAGAGSGPGAPPPPPPAKGGRR